MEMPKLPEPTQGLGIHRWAYSAEDMQAYGFTVLALARAFPAKPPVKD